MHDLCKTNIVLYLGLSIYINIAYAMVIRWSRFSVLHIYKIFIERAYITTYVYITYLLIFFAVCMPLLVHGLQHQCILLHCFCPIWCVNKDYCWCTKYLSLFAIRITLRNPVITFHLPLPIRAFCRRTHIVYLICMLLVLKRKIACKGKVELDIGTI